jgi:hypothetical protein
MLENSLIKILTIICFYEERGNGRWGNGSWGKEDGGRKMG